MNIIIDVKNVNQTFVPEPISLRLLMKETRRLYDQAIHPAKLDGQVKAIFEEAKNFEFFPDTGLYLSSKPVQVLVRLVYINGGMQPPKLTNFLEQAGQIAWLIDVFLKNTDNSNLHLPSLKNINLCFPGIAFPIPGV